jgi:hypothetical protein
LTRKAEAFVKHLWVYFPVSDVFDTTPVAQLFGDNYKHLTISLILMGDFRKGTHTLYMENSTTNKSPTSLEANRSILDMQGEEELFIGMNRTDDPFGQQGVHLLRQTSHLPIKG